MVIRHLVSGCIQSETYFWLHTASPQLFHTFPTRNSCLQTTDFSVCLEQQSDTPHFVTGQLSISVSETLCSVLSDLALDRHGTIDSVGEPGKTTLQLSNINLVPDPGKVWEDQRGDMEFWLMTLQWPPVLGWCAQESPTYRTQVKDTKWKKWGWGGRFLSTLRKCEPTNILWRVKWQASVCTCGLCPQAASTSLSTQFLTLGQHRMEGEH